MSTVAGSTTDVEQPAQPLRIGLVHLMQETDTFNPVPTTIADFEMQALLEGDAMLARIDPNGPIAGYLTAVERSGLAVETLPVLRADAQSGGRLSSETLHDLCERIATRLRALQPVDGLVVLLHGAAAADGVDDVEGHVLAVIRRIVGPEVPLALMLDHHANVTEEMMRHTDLVMAFRTQPHDPFDTGHDLTRLALRLFRDEVHPTTAWRKIPMITHQEQYLTASGPMKEWFDMAREVERSGRALTVSQFPMQPWLDVEEAGWAVVVVTDDDAAAAEALADELASAAWGMRRRFMERESRDIDQAITVADDPALGAVLLSDTGDSVLGGSPGDSTVILAALLRRSLQHRALVPLTDPVAARRLHGLAAGDPVDIEFGGWSNSFSEPLRVIGTMRAAGEGPVALAGLPQGSIDMGAAVVLDVGRVTVLVTEHPGVGGIHPGVYRALGVEPADYKMIVMKTASNFQYMSEITTTFVRVATPGPTQSDVASLPWSRIPRPMFPLDEMETWR
jgi:microcystin degradation protein MlrC